MTTNPHINLTVNHQPNLKHNNLKKFKLIYTVNSTLHFCQTLETQQLNNIYVRIVGPHKDRRHNKKNHTHTHIYGCRRRTCYCERGM